jgi:N-acetylmuramoyl-L-alanine amidase
MKPFVAARRFQHLASFVFTSSVCSWLLATTFVAPVVAQSSQNSRPAHGTLGGPAVDASSAFAQRAPRRLAQGPATPSLAAPAFSSPAVSGAALGGEAVGSAANNAARPSAESPASSGAAPTALGTLPIDLSQVRRIVVAGTVISEAPLRVGNVDVLAPIVGENSSILSGLGASASRASLNNLPGNPNTPTTEQAFQINLPQGDPIVLTVGKSMAYIKQAEQPLRAAPLVISGKIWLPIFSLAPMLGAAVRLDPSDGTLHVNPTIQSVELFSAKGYTVMTIKASAPLRAGGALMGTMDDPPKVYFDFQGYSMGFDAFNSTGERIVSAGLGPVEKARAGMFESFPDKTRVVLDLKKKMNAVVQPLPDKTLFAIVLVPPGGSARPNVTNVKPGPTGLRDQLRGITIVVDAGHGGHDSGARGKKSVEKSHALDIAKRLRNNLVARGATVLMTRETDNFISLQGRVDFANSRRADIFFSVHINSFRSTSSGTETFFWTGQSAALAREVHQELARATGLPNRGVSQARFYVIRNTWMPSILTETAFISNAREEALLVSPAWREKVARGMAQGVANYVERYGIRR